MDAFTAASFLYYLSPSIAKTDTSVLNRRSKKIIAIMYDSFQ